MSNSFKQMVKGGTIKRADAMRIRVEDIHEEEGFNLRDLAGVDADGVSFEDSIKLLAEYIKDGGQIPPLEVRPRDDGGVWVVDGHRRRRALLLADQMGAPLRDPDSGDLWVHVLPFTGNDAERVARILTSQENRKLTPLETAQGYKRLAAFGWTSTQIAKAVGKTRQHVEHLLVLANADTSVQVAVREGKASAATAVQLVQQHGGQAATVLQEEITKAAKAGKGKVTAATIQGKALPRKLVAGVVDTMDEFVQLLPKDARVQLAELEGGITMHETVAVNANALLALIKAHRQVQDERGKAAAKQREAEEQAKQLDIGAAA